MVEVSKLEALAHLRNSGALTEHEYQVEKSRLLRRSPIAFIVTLTVGVGVGIALVSAITYWPLDKLKTHPGANASNSAVDLSALNTPLPGAVPAPIGKLASVFKDEMLDARVAYLESLVGPAMSVSGGTRTYKIDGCDVEVETKGQDIVALGLRPSNKCDFNLDEFVPNQHYGSASRLTFGRLGPGNVTSDCVLLCGNAYDPEISITVEGSHADNFHTIVASTQDRNEGTAAWVDAMEKARGEDWVIATKFNCDHTFDGLAKKALGPLRVERITVYAFPPERTCKS